MEGGVTPCVLNHIRRNFGGGIIHNSVIFFRVQIIHCGEQCVSLMIQLSALVTVFLLLDRQIR